MGYPTNIEWTDATWNPVGGCEIHSPGCANCYAMPIAASGRLRDHPLYKGVTKLVKGKPVFNGMLTALPDDHPGWLWPLKWKGAAQPKLGAGKPSMIFVGDMSDLCHHRRPIEHIDRTLAPIVMSDHIGQFLTKRPDRMAQYLTDPTLPERLAAVATKIKPLAIGKWIFRDGPSHNVWLGFSAERQREMDERAHHFRKLAEKGWQIFVSIEPLLDATRLPLWFQNMPRKPWIIVGGESGKDARVFHPDWVRTIRDEAAEYGCPFFFKQWGAWWETASELRGDDGRARIVDTRSEEAHELFDPATDCFITSDGRVFDQLETLPSNTRCRLMTRLGKRNSGRELDGVEHNAFPVAA